MGWDLAIVETGNGGDLTTVGNDIGIFLNDENEIYLRLFGGNVEGDTKLNRKLGEDDKGYWANSLLFGSDPNLWFNSLTERALDKNELSSQGRVNIENAVKKDLQGMDVTVNVSIVGPDRLKISIGNNVTEQITVFTYQQNGQLTGDFHPSDFSSQDFNT
jgi:phage gp46-like protein